jgi:hypothetical protein
MKYRQKAGYLKSDEILPVNKKTGRISSGLPFFCVK